MTKSNKMSTDRKTKQIKENKKYKKNRRSNRLLNLMERNHGMKLIPLLIQVISLLLRKRILIKINIKSISF